MAEDVERAAKALRETIGGNDWWAFSAPESLEKLVGVANQDRLWCRDEDVAYMERVEKLRLTIQSYLCDGGDPKYAIRATEVLVELAEKVRASQFK
jgi:hypothetical protein